MRRSASPARKVKARLSSLAGAAAVCRLDAPAGPRDGVVVVHADDGQQPAIAQAKDAEGRLADLAPHHRRVELHSGTDVLDVQVVLLGPEPRRLVVWRCRAGHRVPHREPLALPGLEML